MTALVKLLQLIFKQYAKNNYQKNTDMMTVGTENVIFITYFTHLKYKSK